MDERTLADLGDPTRRHIRCTALRLCTMPGFTRSDQEDLEQDLVLAVLTRATGFDPKRSQYVTFAARVVDSAAQSLIRHRNAQKRSPDREQCSLNDEELFPDGEDMDCAAAEGGGIGTAIRTIEMRDDLATVLGQCSETHRTVAMAVRDGSVNAAAQRLGLSRNRVTRCMRELRELCADEGLNEYL
jgi:RNA polymerase sigma factor (sigma-70 family)